MFNSLGASSLNHDFKSSRSNFQSEINFKMISGWGGRLNHENLNMHCIIRSHQYLRIINSCLKAAMADPQDAFQLQITLPSGRSHNFSVHKTLDVADLRLGF